MLIEALLQALTAIFQVSNIIAMCVGVSLGLLLGAVPGLGGVMGLSILMPFVFDLPPTSSIIMLMSLAAVASTSDSIPAILFGIPGTAAAQATILDGYPMAKRGEAGRALGASFTASAIGGLLGAVLLFFSVPLVRPVVLQFGSPEIFMLSVLGITLVATLSQGATAKGISAGLLGVLLTTIGQDPVTGAFRYVFDMPVLWEGLPLVAVALGIFALPELFDLIIAPEQDRPRAESIGRGRLMGMRDVVRHWGVVIRSSAIGIYVGLLPGIGGSVVDWFAYGTAKQFSRNSGNFGKGDVRGVIAVDAASNAKEGGALVTTIAFGIPGSVTMALLLGAFDIHGIAPGPAMLTTNASLTFTMAWALVFANLIAAAICLVFVGGFARISQVKPSRLYPVLLAVIIVGAFQATSNFFSVLVLVTFGTLGWCMKRAGWPRPPLILGFILGSTLENTLFLSIQRYGSSWLTDPIPLTLGLISVGSLVYSAMSARKSANRLRFVGRPRWAPRNILTIVIAMVGISFATIGAQFPGTAKLFPLNAGVTLAVVAALILVVELFFTRDGAVQQHLDIQVNESRARKTVTKLILEQLAYLLTLIAAIWLVGLSASFFLFITLFLKFKSRESWPVALGVALAFAFVIDFIFGGVLNMYLPEGAVIDFADLAPFASSWDQLVNFWSL